MLTSEHGYMPELGNNKVNLFKSEIFLSHYIFLMEKLEQWTMAKLNQPGVSFLYLTPTPKILEMLGIGLENPPLIDYQAE
jgi:hypothetical protein